TRSSRVFDCQIFFLSEPFKLGVLRQKGPPKALQEPHPYMRQLLAFRSRAAAAAPDAAWAWIFRSSSCWHCWRHLEFPLCDPLQGRDALCGSLHTFFQGIQDCVQVSAFASHLQELATQKLVGRPVRMSSRACLTEDFTDSPGHSKIR
ncbi:unnamed protein product, partial [Symbiodinium microadriaticum]